MTDSELNSNRGLLPTWAYSCGWVFLVGQTLFIGRIVYESTVLTCAKGPQMVGFAMAHGANSFFLLGLLFVPLGGIFSIAMLIFGAVKGFRFKPDEWGLLMGLSTGFLLLWVPYRAWENLDMRVCSSGPLGDAYLLEAARTGNLDLVKRLVTEGHNVNRSPVLHDTPLSSGVKGGKLEVVRYLIVKGANVNGREGVTGETPLMEAANTGDMEMLKLLLEQGADPCAIRRDWDPENAQRIAEKKHNRDAAEYLSAHSHCSLPPPPPTTCANQNSSTCVEVH